MFLICNLTRSLAYAASSGSECDDASGDENQSFESCEHQKSSGADSPQLQTHSGEVLTEPSPSSVAVAALSRLSVETSNPFAALAADSPAAVCNSEDSSVVSTPLIAAACVEKTVATSASVSPVGSGSSISSQSRTPDEAGHAASASRPADASDGTDDAEQRQVFDCFDLKIVYERGRTGFEDTKEIVFTPGMLIAVRHSAVAMVGCVCKSNSPLAAGPLPIHSIFRQCRVQQRVVLR